MKNPQIQDIKFQIITRVLKKDEESRSHFFCIFFLYLSTKYSYFFITGKTLLLNDIQIIMIWTTPKRKIATKPRIHFTSLVVAVINRLVMNTKSWFGATSKILIGDFDWLFAFGHIVRESKAWNRWFLLGCCLLSSL